MSNFDRARAIGRLKGFLSLAAVQPGKNGPYLVLRNRKDEVTGEAHVIEAILDVVIPEWRSAGWVLTRAPFALHREAAIRAVAALEAQEEIAEILGDGAPSISAGGLHAWVWDSARTLWGSGHYREAVNAAARAINAHAQTKLRRRDESEWKLIFDAFRVAAPEAGHPRLRLMVDDGSTTFTNLHEGAGFLARGLFQGIRNPANHDALDELDESVALEQLAAFSVLARWIDAASVETS